MVRLGVVGYGLRIDSFIRYSLRKICPDLQVVGVVDKDEKTAVGRMDEKDSCEVKFYKNLDEMMRKADVDALMIGTRCNTHTPLAIEASKYDVPLFLEKPVAINMEQAMELEKAFTTSRAVVVVSFPLRVSPLCEFSKKLIKEDAVGKPVHVSAVNYVPYGSVYWEQGYRDYDITQGLFLQKATHDLDYLSYLMNSPIVRIAAMASYGQVFGGCKPAGLRCSECEEQDTCLESPRNRGLQNPSAGFLAGDHLCLFSTDCGSPETGTNEDCSSALLEFANGAHGVYSQVFFARNQAAARGATISGYNGTVSLDWYKNEVVRVRHHSSFCDVSKPAGGNGHFGGDDVLALNFLDVIKGNAKPKTTIWHGIQSVYTCLAAKQSAETGAFQDVRQIGDKQ